MTDPADGQLEYLPVDAAGTCACGRPAVKTDGLGRAACSWCARYVGPPVVGGQPPARNDPCVCGSGKKYKKCCGRSPDQIARANQEKARRE